MLPDSSLPESEWEGHSPGVARLFGGGPSGESHEVVIKYIQEDLKDCTDIRMYTV